MAVAQTQDPTQAAPQPAPTDDSDQTQNYTPQQKAAAVAGYKRGVSLGLVDPDDGLNRLKKISAVHPATQKEELLDSMGPQQGPDPKPQQIPGQNPWMHDNQNGGWTQPQDDEQPGQNVPPSAARSLNRSPAAGFIGPKTQAQAIAAGQYQPSGLAQARDNGTGQTTGSSRTMPSLDMSELDPLQQAALGYAGGQPQHQNTESQSESNSTGTKNQSGSTRQLFDPQTYQQRMDAAINSPLFQKQQNNVDRLKQLLNMQQGITANAPPTMSLNLKPLLAYADQLQQQDGHKSNLADSYTPPPTPQQNMITNIGMQQKMLGDDNDLQKSVYENMRTANPNLTLTDLLAANTLNKQDAGTKEVQGNLQSKLPQVLLGIDRINQRGNINAQNTVNKDPIMNTYSQRITGADKILKLMNGADDGKLASTQSLLGQLNAEVARLETGSQSPGLGAAEKTEMNSFQSQLQNVIDTFSGAVTPVDLHEKFKQARGMVADLRKSYVDASNQRLQELQAGTMQNQQPTFTAKIDALQKQYSAVPATKTKLPPKAPLSEMPGYGPTTRVPVNGPNGEKKTIPAAQLKAFLADPDYKGWKATQ